MFSHIEQRISDKNRRQIGFWYRGFFGFGESTTLAGQMVRWSGVQGTGHRTRDTGHSGVCYKNCSINKCK